MESRAVWYVMGTILKLRNTRETKLPKVINCLKYLQPKALITTEYMAAPFRDG